MVPPGRCENNQQGTGTVGQQLAGTTVAPDGWAPSVWWQKPDLFLPSKGCPPLSFLGISPLSWRGRSPAVSLLPSPPRGVLSPILHPQKEQFQRIRGCGAQRQGPRAPRWPDPAQHFHHPCHGPIPLPFNYACKVQPFSHSLVLLPFLLYCRLSEALRNVP